MTRGLERVDVGRVLQRLGIEATKKSKEWYAACPNPSHKDSHPSFRVRDEPGSDKTGFFKCFPCNWGGGILELIRWRLRLESHGEAKAWLFGDGNAELAAEPINVEAKPVVEALPPRLSFRLPPEASFTPFERWPAAVQRYWLKRGLLPEQVTRWGVGYAVSGRLGGRIIIPSRDERGRAMSYTARDFTDSATQRYMQPQPHERARLSAMFGEQHWPPYEARRHSAVVLVEGEINGLAVDADRPGTYFGATAGSSLRDMHALKLAGWMLVLVMTDPDRAGDALADDVRLALAREQTRVERLRLPENANENDAAKLRALRPGALKDMLDPLLW